MIRLLGYIVVLFAVFTGQLFAQSAGRDNSDSTLPDSKKIVSGSTPALDSANLAANSSVSGSFVLGATMGAPSGVSVPGGLYFSDLGVRISGGSWGKNWNGVQGDLSFNFLRRPSFVMSISVIGGQFQNKSTDSQQGGQYVQQKYYGLAYDMDLAGFFLQTGLATGPGEYSNPQITFQFGYLWEF